MKIQIESNIIRHLLRNVYFFNGTAYAGKSTMVHLLAEKYGAIECGENYHDCLTCAVDAERQPNLCYFDTMSGWQEFVTRTPDEYHAWMQGVSREAAELEIVRLIQLAQTGRLIFVDTNIPLEILHEISDYNHVAIMLSPPHMSVDRFFDRPDAEKQFIYQQLLACPDPDAALANYRRVLEKLNSPENYRQFAESGFATFVRDENSTINGMMKQLEDHFGLAAAKLL